MSVTIHDVLDELRASSISESDKGSKFERLIKAFLLTDPVYSEQFSGVWTWSEWPDNGGKHDTGIDLVAKDRETGQNVAIQCKFFAPTTTVSKPMIDSFMSASGKRGFGQRIIVSTTDKWNPNAEDAIKNQQIPVRRLSTVDLEWSSVDWADFSLSQPDVMHLAPKKTPRPHQRDAMRDVIAGFDVGDRGKLIMACGTGKTFTSLRLAEKIAGAGGSVLFLVPSISLLSQTVREWVSNADVEISPLAVCSDAKVAKRVTANPSEDISVTDLALPATTNVGVLISRLDAAAQDPNAMTVVFGTYQSIDVVALAQKKRGKRFDLIVCDEAHRTTGTTLAGNDESAFVRVHNNEYLQSAKRLYMTATPRIFGDASKAKAGEANAVLCSMDDASLYGPEFHRLGFGEAVERDLLTDYKVLVLAVDEESVARYFQQMLSESELQLDDAAKIVGCWNGLAKRGLAEHSFEPDTAPMRRAVAFAGNIADSKRIEELFTRISNHYAEAAGIDDKGKAPLQCQVHHVDGTFNALVRNSQIDWLQGEPKPGDCRILTNARCLSEGVDVPALDAVMFLSPRKSVVDIVQSVGRVMRKADGKQFGYIILPIGIPAGMSPEQALNDNKRYAAVWEVLQALRAHDERFDAMVNRISLTKARDNKINVIGVGGTSGDGSQAWEQAKLQVAWENLDALRDALYSKIVAKVGTRRYWADWARSVADIATRQTTRIKALLSDPTTKVAEEFAVFLNGLRGNLNEGISQDDAIDMLAQHLITRPVFNALFEGYNFLAHNPVAQTMERMLNALDEHNVDDENRTLEKFYDSVRMRVKGIDSAEGRQRIIVELYDTFFATAFKKTVEKLGIVYTPVEVVDFILQSADQVLRAEFGQGLTAEGVHVLDGFTGTGTFMVRLIQSGLVKPHDLARKYAKELHANEILLLAYYIAAVNIETTYQDEIGSLDEYRPFPGLILTDTFQSWEDNDRLDFDVFRENNARLEKLKQLPITVIVGNPPYSVGQDSANDDNANEEYPSLDTSIRASYAARSSAVLLRNLYDSYVRAVRWASLRIDRGVIAYVTNNGFLDSNTFDGMRKVLAEEFSAIYVYNLRGNQRTAGEQSRKEGGKVFGGGSRAGVAITVLVKNPDHPGPAQIRYADIGDYLSRNEKLAKIASVDGLGGLELHTITPNEHGDWVSQRHADFGSFAPLTGTDGVFGTSSLGVSTSRDAWTVTSSKAALSRNVSRTIEAFNTALAEGRGEETVSSSEISWSRSLRSRFARKRRLSDDPVAISPSTYRPFFKQWLATNPALLEAKGSTLEYFGGEGRIAFSALRPNDRTPFAVLMIEAPPNLGYFMDPGQVVPLYAAGAKGSNGEELLDLGFDSGQTSNVTDRALGIFRGAYGSKVKKEDIFFYVYGLLHSPDYRQAYAADLTKLLPRIPLVEDLWPFVEAGHDLSEIHLGYENATPYPLEGLDAEPVGDSYSFFRTEKMAYAKVRVKGELLSDRSAIVYSSKITLNGIPDGAHRYMLGSRSAIGWIMDRYQVKRDKESGIVNDPNDWSKEVGDPRYILDLLARIVTVSLETMTIVDALPALSIRANQSGAS